MKKHIGLTSVLLVLILLTSVALCASAADEAQYNKNSIEINADVLESESENDPLYIKYMNQPMTMASVYGASDLTHNKIFEKADKLYGIDVSFYQGDINWKNVKAAGIDFAIIRVGYRGFGDGSLVVDTKFKENLVNAKAAGVDIGLYFFTQAINVAEAKQEADFVINQIKGYKLEMPIYFDIEELGNSAARFDAANLSYNAKTDICKAFCNTVQKAGYKAGVYANKYCLLYHFNANELAKSYNIWLGHFTNQTDYNGQYNMWQYTGNGRVNGISTIVDMNVLYMNKPSIAETDLPANVSGFKASSTDNSAIKLTWNKVNNADGYVVYQTKNGKWTRIAKIDANTNTYTVNKLTSGTTYKFAIRAYKNVKGKEALSPKCQILTSSTNPANITKATFATTDNSVQMSWNKVAGATGYRVYKYNASTKKWQAIANIKNTSYTFTKLNAGTTYNFTVRAYKTLNKMSYMSPRYTTFISTTNPMSITKVNFTTTENSIKMNWNKVAGATGYRVYKYNVLTKNWQGIENIKNTSYTFSKLKAGTTYKFTVRAYKSLNGKTYMSPRWTTFTSNTNPAMVNFTLTDGNKKATVKWNKVTGATGYKIYYKTSKNGRWIGLKTTNNKTTSYTKTGLEGGKTYYFTVRAYITLNGKTYNGKYLSNKAVQIKKSFDVTQQEINNFFSNSGFIGHSTGLGLKNYFQSFGSGFLGNPKMLVKGCYSFYNDSGVNGSAYQLSWNGYTSQAKNVIKYAKIKNVFINMGTNDFVESVDNVYKKYVSYLNGIKKVNPNAVIYIEASTPVYASGQRGGVTNQNMNALNAKMKSYCQTQSDMYFIDISTPLKDRNGALAAKYVSDGYVHLTNAAYRVWTDTVVNFVKNQLINEKYAEDAVKTYLANKNNINLKNAKNRVAVLEKSRLKTALLGKLK